MGSSLAKEIEVLETTEHVVIDRLIAAIEQDRAELPSSSWTL